MMPAATHFDPVVGVDVHMIQPPGPVPPVPIPHPYVGIHFDAFDYAPIIGATIKVNGITRAIAGTAGKAIPVHIPIGGVFVPVLPGNEHEAFMGALTVEFDGDAANFMALPCLSCQSIGIPPPPRLNPKKGTKINVPVAPLSVVLPVAKGPPVLIGGPPTISIMSLVMHLIGPLAQLFGMTRVGKRVFAAGRRAADRVRSAAKKVWRKAFAWMPDGFIKCRVLRAEPVDVRTGEVVVDQLDFELPGRIPLLWKRYYRSSQTRIGVCGRGWDTPADARLERQADGGVLFLDGEGTGALFDEPPLDGPVREPVDGWVLDWAGGHWTVRKKGGLTWYFPAPHGDWQETLVEAVVDARRNSVHFLRGAQGLERVVESAGRSFEVVSRDGLIERLVLHHPDFAECRVMARFEYDAEARLVAVYDALDHPYRFAWHADGRMARHTNRVGLSFYYDYDEAGRCVHAWGDGGLFDYHFTYDPDGRWTNFTDSLGHRWSVEMDERGNLVRETDPLGGVTDYAYDEAGRTVEVTDPDGYVSGYTYDEHGNLIRVVRADGSSVCVDFDDQDRAAHLIDANGNAWRYQYNASGLLEKQVSPLGTHWQYEYDSYGLLRRSIDGSGRTTELVFDDYGNVIRASAFGESVGLQYDIAGNVIRESRTGRADVTYVYDLASRLKLVTRSGQAGPRFDYDPAGRMIRHSDAAGKETRLDYFGMHKLQRRTFPDGSSVEYVHDTEEQLICVINESGQRHHLTRDERGLMASETDYWGNSTLYHYTAGRRLSATRDSAGCGVDYKVDPVGRVVARAAVSNTAAGLVQSETFSYDGCGNLVGFQNSGGKVERRYDAHGRLVAEQDDDRFTVSFTFDDADRRLSRTISIAGAAGDVTSSTLFTYNEVGALIKINPQEAPGISFSESDDHRVLETTFGRDVRRRVVFNEADRVTAQAVLCGEEPISEQDFSYDDDGNLAVRSDSQTGCDRYAYDGRKRLVQCFRDDRGFDFYDCDAAGNRIGIQARQQPDDVQSTRLAQYNGCTYRFDARGRLIERVTPAASLRLSWDGFDRLSECSADSGQFDYTYDSLSRRTRKEGNGTSTQFFWAGDELVAELRNTFDQNDEQRTTLREWVYLPHTLEPLAVREVDLGESGTPPYPGNVFLYHNDPNGLPSRMLDASGTVVWAGHPGAWGDVSESGSSRVQNPLRLQGQYHDAESGLNYNRHRYFDPMAGSFICKDPLGLLAGTNPYEYAPNAFAWVDLLGLANCRVYRVETVGGRGERIFVDDAGKISIPDDTRALHVSFGTDTHAQHFVEEGRVIKSFEVPEEVVEDLKRRAVPQREAARVHKAQIAEAGGAHVNPPPQIDDPKVSKRLGRDERDALGITGTDIKTLESAAVPGSYAVVPTRSGS